MVKVRKFFDKLITEPKHQAIRTAAETNYNPYIDKPISQHSSDARKGKKKSSSYSTLHNCRDESKVRENGNMDQESLTTSSKPYSSLKSASPPISPVHSIRRSFANANKKEPNEVGLDSNINPAIDSISSLELSPIGSATSITSSFNLPTVARHDAFYSLVKVDKFKFSQRGTLLNFKTRQGNGSDIFVCDENGRKIRKRRSRRKRRSVRRKLSLSSSVPEGDEINGEVVDTIGPPRKAAATKDDVSFVSIATTATTVTSLTTSINGVDPRLGNEAATPIATRSGPVRKSILSRKSFKPSMEATNGCTPITTTFDDGDIPVPPAPATPYNSPTRFGSQFDPCFNVDNFKVKIIPDVASYQPSFLQKRGSMHTLESRVTTPNKITNTTNTTNNSKGTKVATGLSAASSTSLTDETKSITASLYHQQIEFGKRYTRVVEEGLKSSSLSAHASIRDIKQECSGTKTSEFNGVNAAAVSNFEADSTDVQSLLSLQLSHYAVDCGEFEENAPLLGKRNGKSVASGFTGDADYSETIESTTSYGESRDLVTGAATQINEKLDHKWIIQVKDRLQYYYNANLSKLRRIKLHHQKARSGEGVVSETEKPKPVGILVETLTEISPTTSSSTLNPQSGLYSHQNKRSSKINVVENDCVEIKRTANGKVDFSNTVDSDGFYVADEAEKEDDLTGAIYFIKNDKEEAQSGVKEANVITTSPSKRVSKLLYYHRQQLQQQFKFAPSSFARANNKDKDEDDKTKPTNGLLNGLQNMLKHGSSNKMMMMAMTPPQSPQKDSQVIEFHSPCEVEESSSNDGDDEQSYRGRFDSDVTSSVVSLAVGESFC
ncbi:hypothetical protein CORT_0E05140 [Candida orthopsilosis Co 90-125]|uniref:Uncharacterized protein n=1 Tax=Candida orthopsilosis (strain 90-125) TaxID=1136231 RepID=H8X800_CANO9|nr:hypothetical protein CORT_0E05140 [Candida orthopsilosis Co 90-125]CCG24099.1 hypothetical protein CORT_0E05140 [Candida orthopsilosis Co 90-125]